MSFEVEKQSIHGSLSDVKNAEEGLRGNVEISEDIIAVRVLTFLIDSVLILSQEVTGAIGWDDPNLDKTMIVLEDDSPYPEVRAAVANTDDVDMPASTLRSWVIGLLFAIVVPGISLFPLRFSWHSFYFLGLNQFFFFRFPSITILTIASQLIIFPIGRLWASVMPNKKIYGVSINPGPFTVKEHV